MPGDVLVRMPGVGGTGVVTVSAILQMAAHLDGRHASGLEQTGLAQKGGPVVSDVRISPRPIEGQLRAGAASVDVILGFDLLGAAAPETLAVADRERTVAVLNTAQTPTARMVTDPSEALADTDLALERVDRATRSADNVHLDARASPSACSAITCPPTCCWSAPPTSRAACRSATAAIEQAIGLNGAAVETNLAAFRWGRAAVADPDAVARADGPAPARSATASPTRRAMDDARRRAAGRRAAAAGAAARGRAGRLPEPAYAQRYLDEVVRVARIEPSRPAAAPVAEAYAHGLHKLMAYKDEYEVARLHLWPPSRRAATPSSAPAPRCRSSSIRRCCGRWAWTGSSSSAAGRPRPWARCAGPAGCAARARPVRPRAVRRVERALVGEYRRLVDGALEHLTPATAGQVAAIAALPDLVRGYEDIKLASVERFREQGAALARRPWPAVRALLSRQVHPVPRSESSPDPSARALMPNKPRGGRTGGVAAAPTSPGVRVGVGMAQRSHGCSS